VVRRVLSARQVFKGGAGRLLSVVDAREQCSGLPRLDERVHHAHRLLSFAKQTGAPFAAPQPLRPAQRANLRSRGSPSHSAVVSSPSRDGSDSPCIGPAGTARVLLRPTAAPALVDSSPLRPSVIRPLQARDCVTGVTGTAALAWAKTLPCAKKGRGACQPQGSTGRLRPPVRSRGSCAPFSGGTRPSAGQWLMPHC